MHRMNFESRKSVRRAEAEKRAEAYNLRTPEQQIAILDSRFGAGTGAKKERTKLGKLIAKGE